MSYRFKITKTLHYYGYPQSEYHFRIDSLYFNGTVKYYGNQGFDIPRLECRQMNNGYFWSMHAFMKAFYEDKLRRPMLDLKENESTTIELD